VDNADTISGTPWIWLDGYCPSATDDGALYGNHAQYVFRLAVATVSANPRGSDF
jgi:hypothetical protein